MLVKMANSSDSNGKNVSDKGETVEQIKVETTPSSPKAPAPATIASPKQDVD